MRARPARHAAGALAAFAMVLGGCGGGAQSPPPAPSWDDPGHITEGAWSLYYSAFSTRDLAAELAKEYAVAPDPSGALVVVSLRADDQRPLPSDVVVTMKASTLTGAERPVRVRRVERQGAVSWLGELSIARREMLIFTVSAKPDAATPAITAQFRRELFLE